jgi:predicted Zn-dependent protease
VKQYTTSVELLESAHRLYDEGRAAMDAHQPGVAIAKFEQSASLSPHSKTLELLGECYLRQEDWSKAALYLSASAGLGCKQFRARFLLAQALLGLGPTWRNDAIQKLEEALALNSNYASARQLLAELHESQGPGQD